MDKIIIGICEDSKTDLKILKDHLYRVAKEVKKSFVIYEYLNGNDFLMQNDILYDLIFLDVQLPDMEGGLIAKKLREKYGDIYIVFISQYITSYQIGYMYEAKNYILKPIKYTSILEEMNRFLYHKKIFADSFVWLEGRQGIYRLNLRKLRYIETDNRQLLFHYGETVIRYNGKLADFEEKLSGKHFFRCNNSYIVNMEYVQKMFIDRNRYEIILITNECIPLSRSKKREFLFRLHKEGEFL